MIRRNKLGIAMKWAIRAAIALLLVLAGITAWWVTGPASRVHQVDPAGIPPAAWPRLSATEVTDLPLSCSFVARDNELLENRRRPHRNHVYLAKHDGRYFIMFSYWFGAEGQPGQAVRYATSEDGISWSEPAPLADPAPEHGVIARGFVQRDGRLFAWYATHTGDTFFRNDKPKIERNIAILESEWMGAAQGWQFRRVVLEGYLNNYAPQEFGDTQIMAVRDSDRETYLAISEDGGISWQVGDKMPLPAKPAMGARGLYLPDEPVTLSYAGGTAHVLLRNNNTFDGRLWAAEYEQGNWSDPYPLDFASDASKFVPLDLSDGRRALIGNFNPDVRRALLHIAVSEDGRDYDRLYRLAPEGQYARLRWRSPQYPHAIVDGDDLLLAVSYGKRAISVCKGAASVAGMDRAAEFKFAPRIAAGICSKNHPTVLRRLFGYAGCVEHFVWG